MAIMQEEERDEKSSQSLAIYFVSLLMSDQLINSWRFSFGQFRLVLTARYTEVEKESEYAHDKRESSAEILLKI